MSELRGFGAERDEFERLGVTLVALSVDGPDESSGVAAEQNLPFRILCDVDRAVITSFGLLHESGGQTGDIAIPALALIGPDRRILWRHVSTSAQDRLPTADVLAAVAEQLARP